MAFNSEIPRIYVACLASYNNGRLHGTWIEASTDIAAMNAKIWDMLAKSPYPNVRRQKFVCADCGESRTVTLSDFQLFSAPECDECGEPMSAQGEPFASAEEWAIHDHEGLGDLGEYAGLAEVARRVSIAELADDRSIPMPVLLAFADDYMSGDWDSDDLEREIDDRYRGTFETWRDMAQDLTEETNDMKAIPEWLQGHIDWDSIARDFELGGDFSAYRDGQYGDLYFFWAH